MSSRHNSGSSSGRRDRRDDRKDDRREHRDDRRDRRDDKREHKDDKRDHRDDKREHRSERRDHRDREDRKDRRDDRKDRRDDRKDRDRRDRNDRKEGKSDRKEEKKEQKEEEKTLKRNFGMTDLESSELLKYARKHPPAGYQDSYFDESDYYFENGLRKVYPYYFTYSTFCKRRWVNRSILDVFTTEFRSFTKEQYEEKIVRGTIMANGSKVPPQYILKDNDLVTNKVHRHEVGVIGAPIKIIHLTDDLVVVDKPPSIPVHPCGRYRHNSLLFILAREHGLDKLHTVHRIDRLTSGIVLLCRNLKKSQELDEQVRSHEMVKEYLCRVEGDFPDDEVTCDKPVEILSPKIGVCIVSPSGKECFTAFQKVSYNGKSSVVRCLPKTGRMHQIRVHLQYLGYPIVNDPIYNSTAFGPLKGKDGETGKTKEQLLEDLMEVHNLDKWLKPDLDCAGNGNEENAATSDENATVLKLLEESMVIEDYKKLENKYKRDETKFTKDPHCQFCEKTYKDPEPKDLMIFLHAYRYKGEDFDFQTEMPAWANDEWNEM